MPNCNIIIPDKLTMESLIRISNDISSNQRLDDDINTHDYKDIERFDLEHHAINRYVESILIDKK